ncbi:class I SAM-dependent methyltransferase [Streptomyces alkaliterrae]|uniref:Methyltransferase domain-containing protein n=1 Tax=Streptomyces alkaliterrae TaxID=2213162 RepID=A0A5P0YLT0_9ACTN|nr:class I SAM-dependent methyltransferase [Streptomyces alkaliterrae]MBB1252701.1 methyltransferase domain-containing protein [Streptomyces alkaliterrae]MBB1258891.1 methyltransferase domain-containing protein [Streptomyces alkaliterrae]MQS00860.1 methyltransferase domain-containing protein [Streptomyces alkaliterrae]
MSERHGHGEHGHQGHEGHEPDLDWREMAEALETEAELYAGGVRSMLGWLGEVLDGAGGPPRRVLDVGSGPGVNTTLLAEAFPAAEVIAVDGSPELLERAAYHAGRLGLTDRISTRHAELPQDAAELGRAGLVWSSRVVHHVGDQQRALRTLAEAVEEGGVLAVVEGGLPARFLPRDIGFGRPGLATRLEVLREEWFTRMRAGLPGSVSVVEHWPALLAEAGLRPVGSRTFLTEIREPLPSAVRRHVHGQLARSRERLAEELESDDLATLDRLLDAESPEGVLRRPDLFLLAANTVHAAVRDGS